MADHDVSYYEKRLVNDRLNDLERDVDNLKRAIPKSELGEIDYMGHRNFHEAAILAKEEEARFWRALRNDLIKKGAWAILVVLIGFAVTGFVNSVDEFKK